MPKNMKYDAVATKAAGPKKKMKTNQDGGSMTAKDPAAAGKQLAADQANAAGPAQRKLDRQRAKDAKDKAKQTNKDLNITGKEARLRVRKAKVGSKAMGSLAGKSDKKADRLLAKEEKLGKKIRNTPSRKERNAQQARKAADEQAGPGRMGYSQKFGPGRMNGYDAGAKKVMDVMTYGAGKYMTKGPGQMKDIKSGERVDVTTTSADGNSYQINVAKGAGYDKLNQKLGGIPHNLRAITTFNKDTDPSASGISAEESKRRRNAYQESLKKKDVKSGTEMRKSSYLPRQ